MNDNDREKLRLLEIERSLVSEVDGILEEALRDHLPIEAYARRTLEVLTKALGARATILDPGTTAKCRARYIGGLITWEFWILDRAAA